MPGEERVVAEAAEAVGTRGLGLGGPQCLLDHLEIHNPWDQQFFLWPVGLVAPWPVLCLLSLQLGLWTEEEGQEEASEASWQQCLPRLRAQGLVESPFLIYSEMRFPGFSLQILPRPLPPHLSLKPGILGDPFPNETTPSPREASVFLRCLSRELGSL